jgi:hypothetical protein
MQWIQDDTSFPGSDGASPYQEKKFEREFENLIRENGVTSERAELRRGFMDAMWIPHLLPFKCRTQSKTHGAVIHVPKLKEAGRYLFGFLCR